MNIKNNKGITLVDISISIMIIFLFSSLITGLIYNYSTSTKTVNRKAEATQYAITVIEKLKQIGYDSVEYALNENEIIYKQNKDKGNYYTLGIDNEIFGGENLQKNGYKVTIQLQKYSETVENINKEGIQDAIIISTVTVEYKVGTQDKNVELRTLLVKEIS